MAGQAAGVYVGDGMNKKDEALKLALEALENAEYGDYDKKELNEAITAIREALAEQPAQQEPVACKTLCEQCVERSYDFCANVAQTTPLPSPPPQRKPLTDEQRDALARQADENDWHDYDIIDAVEAFHGILGDA